MTAGQWGKVQSDNFQLLFDWGCYFVETRLRKKWLNAIVRRIGDENDDENIVNKGYGGDDDDDDQ